MNRLNGHHTTVSSVSKEVSSGPSVWTKWLWWSPIRKLTDEEYKEILLGKLARSQVELERVERDLDRLTKQLQSKE